MTIHEDTSREHPVAAGCAPGGWLEALVRRLAEAGRRRQERRYLLEMDDWLLKDIGLRREDIERAFDRERDDEIEWRHRL